MATGAAGTPASPRSSQPAANGASPSAGSNNPAPVHPGPGGSAGPTVRPAAKSPLVFGQIGEFSGAPGASLAGARPMLQVVARYINDNGGVNGHPIKIISADNGSDPARYLAIAKDMVERQGVIAFLANMVPISAAGAEPYFREKQIPVVGGEGANGLWSTSPMMFFPGGTLKAVVRKSVKYGAQQGKSKFALFYCVEAESCEGFNEALSGPDLAATGAQQVYKAQVSLTQPDFTSECLQARDRGAEAIELATDAATISRVARSCLQQGYKPLFLTASLAVVASVADDPNTEGIAAAVPTIPWFANDVPAAQVMQQAVQKYAPTLPLSTATSATWTAGQLLLKAGANLPDSVTAADLLKGLWSIKNETFGGLAPAGVTFNQDGPASEVPCAFIVQNKGGKFGAPLGSKPFC